MAQAGKKCFPKAGLLLTGCLTLIAAPAQAGFEFSPPAKPLAKMAEPSLAPADAPMPIVPLPDVSAEPLADQAMAAPTQNPEHILKAPAGNAPVEQVYIRRQRNAIPMKAPANQPMDTNALLKATEQGQPVALDATALAERQGHPAQATGALVIDPYPLEKQATHGNEMGTLSLEQAMMEETGMLRPVATPGKNPVPGMRERARLTSRYDGSVAYADRTPQRDASEAEAILMSSLTPIPGGEGEPLNAPVEKAPLAPLPSGAPASAQPSMPKPAVPESYPQPQADAGMSSAPAMQAMTTPAVDGTGAFPHAVGFGRDLPLALALSQVVPPQYSYAFAQNVNVGQVVSWQGGKPWNEVLDEMLASSGMRAVIKGNQITIISANG